MTKRARRDTYMEPVDLDEEIPLRIQDLSLEDIKKEQVPQIDLTDLEDDDDGPEDLQAGTIFSSDEVVVLDCPPTGYSYLESAETFCNVTIRVGDCVELLDGDFLLVKSIVKSHDFVADIQVRGVLYRRSRRIWDMLPKKLNEVCMCLRADVNGPWDPPAASCQISRSISQVAVVRELHHVNRQFPANSHRVLPRWHCASVPEIECIGPLTCRWKYVELYDLKSGKFPECILRHLQAADADDGYRMLDSASRSLWRGLSADSVLTSTHDKGKRRGGGEGNNEAVDLTVEDDGYEQTVKTTITREPRRLDSNGITTKTTQRQSVREKFRVNGNRAQDRRRRSATSSYRLQSYTFGDICAGPGGTTSGAQQAGLAVVFVVDKSHDACISQRLNFPNIQVVHCDLHDWIIKDSRCYRVDVLHVSFPCQPHSPLHTTTGKEDEANVATGYSAILILQKCRPRICTFEQTSGIVTHRGGYHFRALIHQITAVGYSARWRIIDCATLGNVQARKRLFIIASAPGEPLPPFPELTHGNGPDLKPFVTISDVLRRMPEYVEEHMLECTKRCGTPYDENQPLRRAITTSGGAGNLHPSGERSFNLQELALLAQFLPTHKFYGCMTSIKRQIGNAFPSIVKKSIDEKIVRTLRDFDAKNPPCDDTEKLIIDLEEAQNTKTMPQSRFKKRRQNVKSEIHNIVDDEDGKPATSDFKLIVID